MKRIGTQSPRRLWLPIISASIVSFCLVLGLATTTFASTVTISDQAGVLNQSAVRNAASKLGYPVAIYTVKGFNGSTQQFNQQASSALNGHNDMVVMAIDTTRNYLYITNGRGVPLTGTDNTNARQAFASNFRGGDYTGATIGSLNSLKGSIAAGSAAAANTGKASSGLNFNFGTCLLGLVILGGLLFLVTRRNRMLGNRGGMGGMGGMFNRSGNTPVTDNPPYRGNPPYQGNMPYQGTPPTPGYGSGYPPQPATGGGGVNPIVAGGLGAAAGGLLGYEMGKNRGDQDRQPNEGLASTSDQGTGNSGSGSGGFFGGSDTDRPGNAGSGSGGFFGGDNSDPGSGGFFTSNDPDANPGSGGFFGGDNSDQGSGGFFGGDNSDPGSGGFFGGDDSDRGSGGFFGGDGSDRGV